MSLPQHTQPAFEHGSGSAARPLLPGSWRHEDEEYLLRVEDDHSWTVLADTEALGILSWATGDRPGSTGSWRVRDPARPNLGVGVTWTSWEDAVVALADYRRHAAS